MKYFKLTSVICLFLLSVFFQGCVTVPSFYLSSGDNQKSISVKKGDFVKISLEAQLSTGYGWQVSSLSGVEHYGEIKVETSTDVIAGGKDLEHLLFKAVKSGSGYIELKYTRPWISSDAPLRFYKIFLNIHE